MKIIKYLFFLFLLSSFTLVVFVSTQQKKFTYQTEITTLTPAKQVEQHLQNISLWKSWYWEKSNDVKIDSLPKEKLYQFIGNKQSLSLQWQTNQMIGKHISDEQETEINWQIIPNKNQTKIQVSLTGEMNFTDKMLAFFGKGSQNDMKIWQQKALERLKQQLVDYYQFHTIQIDKMMVLDLPQFTTKTWDSISISGIYDLEKLEQEWKKDSIFKVLKPSGKNWIEFSKVDIFQKNQRITIYQKVTTDSIGALHPKLLRNKKIPVLRVKLKGNIQFAKATYQQAIEHLKKEKALTNQSYFWLQIPKSTNGLPPNEWEFHFYFPRTEYTSLANSPVINRNLSSEN
ncbi:MAG: hypothetical protein KGZ81_05580 [Flavobacteriales bacterium]|nr:hypothetical protein [Flavobacteriales bacterium]MBS4040053.1 hypothetical protein [Flavobacteriales bacterium]